MESKHICKLLYTERYNRRNTNRSSGRTLLCYLLHQNWQKIYPKILRYGEKIMYYVAYDNDMLWHYDRAPTTTFWELKKKVQRWKQFQDQHNLNHLNIIIMFHFISLSIIHTLKSTEVLKIQFTYLCFVNGLLKFCSYFFVLEPNSKLFLLKMTFWIVRCTPQPSLFILLSECKFWLQEVIQT